MRPKKHRHIQVKPKIRLFKPQGVPAKDILAVNIFDEELEALRLKNIEGLDQDDAAERMGISQSTFQRILIIACHKVTTALVEGKAINISGPDQVKKVECWECMTKSGKSKGLLNEEIICQPCQSSDVENSKNKRV